MIWRRKPQPVYVVAGFRRSGTTMLMQALEAGGMKVDRAPEGHEERDDYELSHAQRAQGWYSERDEIYEESPIGERFPSRHRGRLIKCLVPMARYCDPIPEGYVVAFVTRSTVDVNRSATKRYGLPFRPEDIERQVELDQRIWTTRDDCPVAFTTVDYDSVVRDPLWNMQRLKESGFPINPKRAARIVRQPQRQDEAWSLAAG